jgi:hypothetical protein
LPEQISDYFEITKVDIKDKFIDVQLNALNLPPKEYSNEKLISKGFHEAIVFQNFPLEKKQYTCMLEDVNGKLKVREK